MDFDKTILLELITTPMPFGKYKGRLLSDLPEYYLAWFARKGFPNGKLGKQLALMHEIKMNGLDYLLKKLKSIS